MSRKNRKATDSHPWNFSTVDLQDMARERDRWLDFTSPLDFLSVDVVRRAQNEATRGAYAQLQWLWEQLEPADSILATCVERRLGALKRIPWDIRKKDGLSDAEDLLAEAQLRTVQDFANAIENLDEGIEALAQASFRHYRHIQLLETEAGALRLNLTENWNWARDGYAGAWQWNPAATYGLTRGMPLPVDPASIVTRICARPIDQPAMMLCLDRKNAKAQWLVYNGRYGTPPVFAIMPQGVDESLRKEYIKFAMQCVSNAAGVLPAGADVKTVTPGNGGPDTFSRMIDLSTQELVLRATGGLMTMLTAPGAGTNTATGSAHQDAFDDLAASEGAQIAALLQEKIFAPVLEQWHPGQPQLVEFVMRRPDSDTAAGSVANIAALAASGYRTPDEQVAELTGLQVTSANMDSTAIYAAKAAGYVPTQEAMSERMGMPLQPAPQEDGGLPPSLNSLRVRYAPTMLYPPARAAFERAINMAAQPAAEPPLTGGELAALAPLEAGQLSPEGISSRAATAYAVLRKAVRPAYAAEVAQSESEEELAENRNYKRDNAGRFAETGAATRSHKGGRSSKGNPKNPTTQSNTPLKAAPGAKLQEKVNAVESAHRRTAQKGGSVENVTTIGKNKLNIRAGSPGDKSEDWKKGGGSRHQKQKHGNPPENTSDRDAAKSMVLGKTSKAPKGKAVREHGKTIAVTAEDRKKGEIKNITAYTRK